MSQRRHSTSADAVRLIKCLPKRLQDISYNSFFLSTLFKSVEPLSRASLGNYYTSLSSKMKSVYVFSMFVALFAAAHGAADDDFCNDKSNGYFPDPKNCIKYYHCFDHHVEAHLICPNGGLIDFSSKYINLSKYNIV